MKSLRRDGTNTRTALRTGFIITAIATLLLALPATTKHALAQVTLSDADKTCLGCHGSAGLEKKLDNADTLSLHVDGETFAKSVHIAVGCASCHADVDLTKHPGDKKISGARDYSVASIQICRGCHDDKFKQYQGSIHASLVRDGNAAAPICTDCHSPHAVMSKAASDLKSVPCKNCHSAIFDAYIASTHGKARGRNDGSFAPLCSGCHTAHAIAVASAGDTIKEACLGCHAGALDAHAQWLPNAGLHFEVVSCPACHAPNARRRVDLRFQDNTTPAQVPEQKGVPRFESHVRSAEAAGKGLDAVTLWTLLRTFNQDGAAGKTVLRGRLEVRTGIEAHQLTDKSRAISNCDTCHRQGSEAFQSVTVSVAGPDGRPIRFGASKDVLSSVFSIDSVSGFYAIGGTRIHLLDIALVLAILAGLGVPIIHMTWGWLFRRYLKRQGIVDHTKA